VYRIVRFKFEFASPLLFHKMKQCFKNIDKLSQSVNFLY
jgi:hypothetical protein